MSEVPEYTIRIKPQVSEGGDFDHTFGTPIIMLIDDMGNEVARLRGIGDVQIGMDHEQFADVSVSFALFECEGFRTMTRSRREGV